LVRVYKAIINVKYNPEIPQRQSIRLKEYDYSQHGAYFITICAQNRECLFGEIMNGNLKLNQFGIIASDEWTKLSKKFANLEIDEFIIMPNHVHGILILNHTVGAPLAGALVNIGNYLNRAPARDAPTIIGNIVGTYKSLVANTCLKIFKSNNKSMGKLWQRNYYEHVIRNEKSLEQIREYIINNPINWQKDELNPAGANDHSPIYCNLEK
jgi:putative transposase